MSSLPATAERVLLVNPPVYDTRLHWPKWQQPTILLGLSTYFQTAGVQVKLLDALYHRAGDRLRRERVASLELDGLMVHRWRFGLAKPALARELRELAKSGWFPDETYVECFATFWWEGAAEAIEAIKRYFPQSRVVLLGSYASLTPDHAQSHTKADVVGSSAPADLAALSADLSLYARPPTFTYLSLGNGARTAEAIISEVVEKATKQKVWHFAFAEHAVASSFPQLYRAVLEKLADRRLGVNLYALGNIAPSDLIAQPDLAILMRQAGYAQIFFSDDRNVPNDLSADERLIEEYRQAAELCHRAGFRARTDALNGALCIGRPGEDLARRAWLATFIAHHIGSVILWPYQPSPEECPDLPLEEQNGKLFPFRARSGYTYRDYLDLLGLASVLNAKYRTRTFDFLGDGVVPRLFRESLTRRGWDPSPEVKGSLRLPVVVRR